MLGWRQLGLASWWILWPGWTLAVGPSCGDSNPNVQDLTAPMPDGVDRVAVVFTDPDDPTRVVEASPLLSLNDASRIEVDFGKLPPAATLVLGFRPADLGEPSPDTEQLQTSPVRSRQVGEASLPAPARWYSARPGEPLVEQDGAPAFLTADWARECGPDRPLVYVDLDCDQFPCFVPAGTRSECSDRVPLTRCAQTSLQYSRDLNGRITDLALEGGRFDEAICDSPSQENGYARLRCRNPTTNFQCNVDLLSAIPELDWQTDLLQVVEGQPNYANFIRPPFAGHLAGPVQASTDAVWVVSHGTVFTNRACAEPGVNSTLLLVGPAPGGGLELRSSIPTERCLRFLHPDPDELGAFFGMFLDGEDRWRWGRFDPQGQLIASVQVVREQEASLTPTAVGKVQDRFLIGLSDLRGGDIREREDGPGTADVRALSRVVSVDLTAQTRLSGPVDIPLQDGPEFVNLIVEDASGAAFIGLEDDELKRLDPVSLEVMGIDPRVVAVNRFRLREEPHQAIRLPGQPETFLFTSISGTRYRNDSDGRFEIRGVIHQVEDRQSVAGMFFYLEPAEPLTFAPWPKDDPRKVLVGMVSQDTEWSPGAEPNLEGLLGRYDADRPGFDPLVHRVGPGPITRIVIGADGAVWGILGWTGYVFRTRIP